MIFYLIGMPGCGKSKTAKFLQTEYRLRVVDLDDFVEKKAKLDIPTIMSEYGVEHFRKLETDALIELSNKRDTIIVSCGGGVVTEARNKDIMRKGITIFLDASLETLKQHLELSLTERPLLKKKTVEELYKERINLYRDFAEYTIKYESYQKSANEIFDFIKSFKKILVINGPNLNMLGLRDPNHYGSLTLTAINELMAKDKKVIFYFYQSNHEGKIVDCIQRFAEYDGLIINPAAYTHTSVAIHDALEIVNIPKVEVHLSNVDNREDYRKINFVRDVVDAHFSGEKELSYLKAVDYLKNKLNVI